MKIEYEFRVNEKHAQRLVGGAGIKLGTGVRKVVFSLDDPRLQDLENAVRTRRREGDLLVYSWNVKRRYTHGELDQAQANTIFVNSAFEPCGEECGTVYDESRVCPLCGAGRIQTSELILDLRKAPKGKDIARTIADEVIISQRFAELLRDVGARGCAMRPVRHRFHFAGHDMDYRNVHTGRKMIAIFEEQNPGQSYIDGQFAVWLNREENRALREQAEQEIAIYQEKLSSCFDTKIPKWHQLVVTSPPVPIGRLTKFGKNPFDPDDAGEYRCPRGHVAGLNILSEVHARREDLNHDVMQSKELVGRRSGVLVPAPILMFSTALSRTIRDRKLKGFTFEAVRADGYS